jgi:hypothetical protein
MDGNIFNSQGVHVATVRGSTIFNLRGEKLYDLRGINIYKLSGELVGHLASASASFKHNDATPKDTRLLLITQPSGTPDGQEIGIHDVVVDHRNSHLAGFVQAIAPSDQSAGSMLRVVRWAELTTPPSVQLRKLDGLL